jgi:hypothetical protein
MTKQHDYKAALEDISQGYLLSRHIEAVIHALRMMEKLENPSDTLIQAMYDAFHAPIGMTPSSTKAINSIRMYNAFKAVLDQAKKEIENDLH